MKPAIILLALILLGGITSAYIVYQYNSEANEDISNHVLKSTNFLKERDSKSNTLILEARYGLRTDYDDLARQVRQLRQGADVFSLNKLAVYADSNTDIQQALSIFYERLNIKINHIENFKSHNSILRNSLQYAPELGDQLIAESQKSANEKNLSQLNEINEALYRWILSGDNKEVEFIQEKAPSLINLYQSVINDEVLARYINHIDTALKEQKTTQGFINSALNVDLLTSIENVERAYLDHYIAVIKSAEQRLYYVFAYALIVLIIAIYFWITLNHNYSRLQVRDKYRSQQISIVSTYLSNTDTNVGAVKDSLIHIKETLKYLKGIYLETKRSNYDKKKVNVLLARALKKYRSLERDKIISEAEEVLDKSNHSLDRVSTLVKDMNV